MTRRRPITMSFGFGIGDIVTCTKIARDTIDALRTAGSEFEALRLELASLTSVLSALEAEASGPMPLINAASPQRQQQMQSLLSNCTASMQDLKSLVTKYKGMNSTTKRDFVAWMRFAAKDKRSPREKLAVHTASLNIFLTTLSHSSLARLEFLVKNGPQRLGSEPGSDGARGVWRPGVGEYSATNTKRDAGLVWQRIGAALAQEGIGQQDVEKFQEELKAYARYLVRGETPFWTAARVEASRERLKTELQAEQRGSYPCSAQTDSKQARVSQSKSEAIQRSNLEQISWSETRRKRLREEIRLAQQSEDVESSTHREEDLRQSRSKNPTVVDLEQVVALADQFEHLFEFQSTPDQARHGSAPLQATSSVPSPAQEDEEGSGRSHSDAATELRQTGQQRRIEEQLRRVKRRRRRVQEIRKKLEDLRLKYNGYRDDRRWVEAQLLEDRAIPLQIELLEDEGVEVLHRDAWKSGYLCDACQFWIPGSRYHCNKCPGSSGQSPGAGNWDICEECWVIGARCPGEEAHEMVVMRE